MLTAFFAAAALAVVQAPPAAPESMPRDHAGPRPLPADRGRGRRRPGRRPEPIGENPPAPGRARRREEGPRQGRARLPGLAEGVGRAVRHADKVEVATAWEWPAKDEFGKADVMVFYQHGDWTPERAADVDAFLERGGGLVYVHWAVDGRDHAPEFAKRIGLASGRQDQVPARPARPDFNPAAKHPVDRNLDKLIWWTRATGSSPASCRRSG